MALIKAKNKRESKKEVSLSNDVWQEIDAYCKFAGIEGTIGAKRSLFLEEAAKIVFNQDAAYRNHKNPQPKQEKSSK